MVPFLICTEDALSQTADDEYDTYNAFPGTVADTRPLESPAVIDEGKFILRQRDSTGSCCTGQWRIFMKNCEI